MKPCSNFLYSRANNLIQADFLTPELVLKKLWFEPVKSHKVNVNNESPFFLVEFTPVGRVFTPGSTCISVF